MALVEKDFELIDDYLSNRLGVNEKAAFEERLKSEHTLSEEFNIQQSLVQGIKQARVAELKTMLNSIPVTSMPPTHTALLTKIGGWALVTGLVVTATYFYTTRNQNEREPVQPVTTEQLNPEPAQEPDTKSTIL